MRPERVLPPVEFVVPQCAHFRGSEMYNSGAVEAQLDIQSVSLEACISRPLTEFTLMKISPKKIPQPLAPARKFFAGACRFRDAWFDLSMEIKETKL